MSEKIQGWREETDDSGYHWLVLRDAQGRLLSVPESREPAYISAGLASRPMAKLLNALTSERDEAVRVAGELRAKAVGPIEYLRKGHSPPQVGCTACEMIAAWDTTLDALTQGGDLPLKEQE